MPSQTTQKKSKSTSKKGTKHVEKTLGREEPSRSRSKSGSTSKAVHEHRTAKVVELVCSSTKGFEDAITNGIKDASQTIYNIHGCEVQNMSISVKDGKIEAYKVDLKLAFGVETTPRP